jgi:hypothetical protein
MGLLNLAGSLGELIGSALTTAFGVQCSFEGISMGRVANSIS